MAEPYVNSFYSNEASVGLLACLFVFTGGVSMLSADCIKIQPNTSALSSTCSPVVLFGSQMSEEQNKAQVILVPFFGAMVTVMAKVQLRFVSPQKDTEK